MKKYLYLLLAIGLCWGGVALSDDDNPFEEAAKEENPFSEVENPFAEVVKDDFNGHYVGKLIDLRLWPEGEIFAGEMKFRGETYPVAAEMRDGGLFCAAGTEEENFSFTLKKSGEKYLVEVGKFKEELEKRVFPVLEEVYEGEKGTRVRISKKAGDQYNGTIEFKGKKMPFEAKVKGGALEGKMESGKSQIDFKIEKGEESLTFQTGAFTDELISEKGKVILPHLKAAREAKENQDWIKVQEEAEKILEIDKGHKEAKELLELAKDEKNKKRQITVLLKEANEAEAEGKWKTVKSKAEAVLALESGNTEARQLRDLAEKKLKGPQEGEPLTVQLNGEVRLEMVGIKPGTFTMGSPDSELGRFYNEKQHQVTLTKGYWLGKYEVTQRQWKAVMGDNPSNFKGDDQPVEQVSWENVMKFCRNLTAQERKAGRLSEEYEYTLPTEAQWEYACRAGTTAMYNNGSGLNELGWCDGNSVKKAHPVGQKKPNAWGLYDMHGNVWEWCLDWYGDYPPSSVSNPKGVGSGSRRVNRGGGWRDSARGCRSAIRSGDVPGNCGDDLGFRLALIPVE